MLFLWLILLSGLADFADGLVARALGAHSELGKQLDSLADVISFGLVPGALGYTILAGGPGQWHISALPAFLLTLAAAFRLGKFNLDERQSSGFLGLPTPAATLFLVGYWLYIRQNAFGLGPIFSESYSVYGLILVLSGLMVSEVPMFGLKFKGWQWAGNEIKFIFVGITMVGLIVLRELAIAPLVLLYVLLSVFWNRLTPK